MNLFSKILILDKERPITLPEEFIGKVIEIIAFPLDHGFFNSIDNINSLKELLKDHRVDQSDYKSERSETNDYAKLNKNYP